MGQHHPMRLSQHYYYLSDVDIPSTQSGVLRQHMVTYLYWTDIPIIVSRIPTQFNPESPNEAQQHEIWLTVGEM
jgi:hypothetical protein